MWPLKIFQVLEIGIFKGLVEQDFLVSVLAFLVFRSLEAHPGF
jgi:hypothetical protein